MWTIIAPQPGELKNRTIRGLQVTFNTSDPSQDCFSAINVLALNNCCVFSHTVNAP